MSNLKPDEARREREGSMPFCRVPIVTTYQGPSAYVRSKAGLFLRWHVHPKTQSASISLPLLHHAHNTMMTKAPIELHAVGVYLHVLVRCCVWRLPGNAARAEEGERKTQRRLSNQRGEA